MLIVVIIAATAGPDPVSQPIANLGDGKSITNRTTELNWSAADRHDHLMIPGVESKTIVTNVVETSDESGCATCEQLRKSPGILIYHEVWGCKPYHPATWKLTTTAVKEVWTWKYRWRNKEWTQTDETVLDKSYKKVVKQDTWKDVEPSVTDTNDQAVTVWWGTLPIVLTSTNWSFGTNTLTVTTNGIIQLDNGIIQPDK